jgi:hypothetical protein
MPIRLPRALDDRCACGHLRGEHFTREGAETERCLLQDCHCLRFERARRARQKNRADTQGEDM